MDSDDARKESLDELTRSSRELYPIALDALEEITSEITGLPPDGLSFGRLSRFFLMHFCDQFVYQERTPHQPPDSSERTSVRIPSWTSAVQSIAEEREEVIKRVLAANLGNPLFAPSGGPERVEASIRTRFLSKLGSKRAPVAVVEPYLKCSFREETFASFRSRSVSKWVAVPTFDVPHVEVNQLARGALAVAQAGNSDRRSMVRSALALTAPTELVEGVHVLSDAAARIRVEYPEVIYTANAYQSSPRFRFWAEGLRKHGARLVTHQHGGGYGIDRFHLGEEFDTSVSDVFYTWGWTDSRRVETTRPLPTSYPERHHHGPTAEYLLVTLPVTTHVYRLQSFLMPSQVSRVVTETVALVNGLAASTRLRIRSYKVEKFPLELLRSSSAAIDFDPLHESGTMASSRSKLVIHNYLGTSWLETLAMNVPTVCFYDPAMYQPREDARPFVESLARVGVIHHSGMEAARFVNQLNGDPSAWWNSADVQEAREAFVARYANFSEDWLQAWTDEFERLLAE